MTSEELQAFDLSYDRKRNSLIPNKYAFNRKQILFGHISRSGRPVHYVGVGGLQYHSMSAGIHMTQDLIAIHKLFNSLISGISQEFSNKFQSFWNDFSLNVIY